MTLSVPDPTFDAASTTAPPLASATLFAPLLFSDIAPVKLFPELVTVIELAPALNVAVLRPSLLGESAQRALADGAGGDDVERARSHARVASASALPTTNETLFAPLLFSETAPVKLFPALVTVIALAPALNVAVPAPACSVKLVAATCVIAPVAVTLSVPEPTLEFPSSSAVLSCQRDIVGATIAERYRAGEIVAGIGQRNRAGTGTKGRGARDGNRTGLGQPTRRHTQISADRRRRQRRRCRRVDERGIAGAVGRQQDRCPRRRRARCPGCST
ncbi:MAG: hypothetical protein WDO24_06740 [Pseudomonadota bacterium]